MNQIKFSHTYVKIGDSKTAKLLAVFNTHYNQLGKDFIEFDTHYDDEGKEGHYGLPTCELLVLLLQDSDGLFTTIRSAKGKGGLDKERYYRDRIGQQFEIVIKR
jgi:hypothetical protein